MSRQRSSGCEICSLRLAAERRPETWLARIWRWHTTWCPGWRRYQRELIARPETREERSQPPPSVPAAG